MSKDLITNLVEIDEIELIYKEQKIKNGKTYIHYTVICDVDNIVSKNNLMLCKRIVATMSVIQTLLLQHKITFSYTIKTCSEFEREILCGETKILNKLNNISILLEKNNYLEYLKNERQNNLRRKRAK